MSTRQFLDHLYDTYGRISAQVLEANDKALREEYDPTQPLDMLFDRVEDAMDLADAAKIRTHLRNLYPSCTTSCLKLACMSTCARTGESACQWIKHGITSKRTS